MNKTFHQLLHDFIIFFLLFNTFTFILIYKLQGIIIMKDDKDICQSYAELLVGYMKQGFNEIIQNYYLDKYNRYNIFRIICRINITYNTDIIVSSINITYSNGILVKYNKQLYRVFNSTKTV